MGNGWRRQVRQRFFSLEHHRIDMRIQSAPAFKPPSKTPFKTTASKPTEQGDLWSDPRPWCPRNQPARLLRETPDGKKTLGGFRWGWQEAPRVEDWKPHFQSTTVDTRRLKDVHFYVEHFFPAGHAALVFEFEDGAIVGSDGQTSNRMVYSIEARKKEGDSWTWQKGLKKTMGMVHQLMTFEDAQQWVQRRQGASLETRPLQLNESQKQALLQTALDEALQDRTGEYYHTTRNSCYSALQRVMNRALPENSVSLHSPLSLGLLMKPESFLTSSYTTVLKDMGIHRREAADFYPPDPGLHPEKHAKAVAKVNNPGLLSRMAESAWFAPALRVAGTLVGAGLGYGLSENLLVGAASGYLGLKTGAITGDLLESQALRKLASPAPHNPPSDWRRSNSV